MRWLADWFKRHQTSPKDILGAVMATFSLWVGIVVLVWYAVISVRLFT